MRTLADPIWRSLEQPPEPTSPSVKELVEKVRTGGVRVPSFQRPLRWQAREVVALFDSLLRGYPVGALVFWQRPAAAVERLTVGGATFTVPAVTDAWWVVDGQQRVTALAAAMLELDHGRDRRWRVYFDAEQGVFGSGPVPLDRGETVVSVPTLANMPALLKWLRARRLPEEKEQLVYLAHERLTATRLNATIMKGADEQALRAVFARTNSAGARMRSDEVFQALMGPTETGAGGRRTLDLGLLAAACDIDGFGAPPRSELQKAALAMAGLDPTRRFETLSADELHGLPEFNEVEAALRAAVAFLQQPTDDLTEPGAGIPAYAFIPYPVVFVILARWFSLHPDPDRSARVRLSRWLWRGAASGAHERAAVSLMRLQVRAIQGDDADADLTALEGAQRQLHRVDWTLQPFHANSATSRIELLALLERRPLHGDGTPVSWREALSSGGRVAREIFARDTWASLSEEGRRLARTAANRALLTDRHTGLRVVLRGWRGEEHGAVLDSHLLDPEGIDQLRADAPAPWEAMLQRRAARLQHAVSAMLSLRAALGEPELRPASHYFDPIDDDDEEDEDEDEGLGGGRP